MPKAIGSRTDSEIAYIQQHGELRGPAYDHNLSEAYFSGLYSAAQAAFSLRLRDLGLTCLWRNGHWQLVVIVYRGKTIQAQFDISDSSGFCLEEAYRMLFKHERGHNGSCPRCGSAAYVGLLAVECSAGPSCGKPAPEPPVTMSYRTDSEPTFRVVGAPAHLIGATPEAAKAAYQRSGVKRRPVC